MSSDAIYRGDDFLCHRMEMEAAIEYSIRNYGDSSVTVWECAMAVEIKHLRARISDMHVPEPIMVKRDGEYVEEGVPNRFGGKL